MISYGQLAQQPGISAPGSAAGGFWTPDNILKVISGVKELMGEYQKLKGIMPGAEPGDNGQAMIPAHSDMQRTQPPGITMPQVRDFAVKVCENLEAQGFGDKSALEVLTAFSFKISEIKRMIGGL